MSDSRRLVTLLLTALNAVIGFYLACFAYRLIAHAAMYLLFIIGVVLHYLGTDAPAQVFVVVASVASQIRDNIPAMVVSAAVAVVLSSSWRESGRSRRTVRT
ncbi:MAG: hypothetical protein ABJA83_04810 [Burkholderiaceae bacterium]